ncbi:hypothetical protein F5888DRAFT_183732 [Russula emetica]|nr:hypothetical protein F5888DRAFT_183732 [Russula emetica]
MGWYSRLLEILWGVCIGVSFGGSFYLAAELISTLETKFIAWESTDLYFPEPDIPVVANTKWLDSMSGRWLGHPMECPSSIPTPMLPPPDTLERDLKPGKGAEPKRHDATVTAPTTLLCKEDSLSALAQTAPTRTFPHSELSGAP